MTKKHHVVILLIILTIFLVACSNDTLTTNDPEVQKAELYEQAEQLLESSDYNQALTLYQELGDYKDATTKVHFIKYQLAEELVENKMYGPAAITFYGLGDYKDSTDKSLELWNKIADRNTIIASYNFSFGIKDDGTVIMNGKDHQDYDFYLPTISKWDNIVSISADSYGVFGIQNDGALVSRTVSSVNSENWQKDLVSVSYNGNQLFGLKADGTVISENVTFPENTINVDKLKNIVEIDSDSEFLVALKTDGTVDVCWGKPSEKEYVTNRFSSWKNIVDISVGFRYILGLKSDGTVVMCGYNDDRERNVSNWSDIVAISAGFSHAVGLRADGTVVATGKNIFGECDVSDWCDIVAVSAGAHYTIGLKSDGTVISVGDNKNSGFDVSDWKNIRIPDEIMYNYRIGESPLLTNGNDTSLEPESSNTVSQLPKFTNKFGTRTTICAHSGCTSYIATSGDTNCCTTHSSRCLSCNCYIDEDALACISCIEKAVTSANIS